MYGQNNYWKFKKNQTKKLKNNVYILNQNIKKISDSEGIEKLKTFSNAKFQVNFKKRKRLNKEKNK